MDARRSVGDDHLSSSASLRAGLDAVDIERAAVGGGMQGLKIRLAKRLNVLFGREGSPFTDRFHAVPITSPRQAKHCLAYVLGNARKHAAQLGRTLARGWIDPFSSAPTFSTRCPRHAGADPPRRRQRGHRRRRGRRHRRDYDDRRVPSPSGLTQLRPSRPAGASSDSCGPGSRRNASSTRDPSPGA